MIPESHGFSHPTGLASLRGSLTAWLINNGRRRYAPAGAERIPRVRFSGLCRGDSRIALGDEACISALMETITVR